MSKIIADIETEEQIVTLHKLGYILTYEDKIQILMKLTPVSSVVMDILNGRSRWAR